MSELPPFRVAPIDPAIAERARREQRSPQYGHPASVELAKGYGPCRSCLRVFRQGEEDRLLFTFNPVPATGLPQPGPIFIHKDACVPFDAEGVPPDVRGLPLFLEGFGRVSWLVRRVPIEGGDVEAALAALGVRGGSPAAFDERCIPPGGVAPPSNTAGILGRRAWPAGRLARLGATRDFHHGLLGDEPSIETILIRNAEAGCFIARVERR